MDSFEKRRGVLNTVRLSGAAVWLSLLACGALRAEGVVRDSIGPVSSGRGGVNIAYDDNLSLINDNPAGLARIGGLRFELGVDLLLTDITYRDPQNNEGAEDQLFALPSAAMSWKVLEAPLPVVVGIGFFMPAGYGAEYKHDHVVYGDQTYHSLAGLYKFMPVVAIDLGHGFSLGGGVGLAYEQIELQAPYTFQEPIGLLPALGNPPVLAEFEADGFGVAWNVGIQYQATPRWRFGLAYVADTRIELEGDFDADVTGSPLAGLTPDPSASYKAEMENTWPRSVGIGTSYRFGPMPGSEDQSGLRGTVGFEFLWFDWSSAFDALHLRLSNGDNPAFDALTMTTRPEDKFPLEWHDSFTIRLGGEVAVTAADTVRAGYIYVTNPVPERTLTPLIPAVTEHTIAVGYGHRFGPNVAVDIAYQFAWSRKQHVDQSEIAGGDFDNSSLRAMAHWFFFGASLHF